MKKLFSLFAAAVMAVSMMAATTFTYGSSVDPQTKDGFTITLAQGAGQNAPKVVNNYETQVDEVRLYLGNTITVSGASITGVELTFTKQGAKDYATLSADAGNLVSGGVSTSNDDPKTDVWTGTASSVTFELGTKGQRILTKIVVYGEGGDTPPTPPTPPTPSGDVTITGLNYVDAIYYDGYWDFDFYNDYNYEEYYYIYPEVYFMCDEEATSGTSIVGTYTAMYAGYWKSANDSIEADDDEPVGTVTVTCVEQGIYNFVGSFVGTDGKTYTWNVQNVEVYAYNGDTYEDITLTDGGTPTPPTPTGDEITIAQAEEIAGALNDNETTTKTYTIKGYVGTLYDSGDFWLVSEPGGRSNLEVYKPTVDKALTKGDYVQVVGKLQKYVSKAGKTILEVVSATVTHIGDTPVPPTPVGTEINVAKAEEIAAALGNNEQTAETYTVIGYAVKAYDPSSGTQDIWMSDTKGAKGNFMAKKTTSTDGTIFDDEYIAVTGKIEKDFYNNKTTLQIYKGTAKHISETALLKIMQNVKVKKMLMDGQVIILKGTQLFDLSGRVIE